MSNARCLGCGTPGILSLGSKCQACVVSDNMREQARLQERRNERIQNAREESRIYSQFTRDMEENYWLSETNIRRREQEQEERELARLIREAQTTIAEIKTQLNAPAEIKPEITVPTVISATVANPAPSSAPTVKFEPAVLPSVSSTAYARQYIARPSLAARICGQIADVAAPILGFVLAAGLISLGIWDIFSSIDSFMLSTVCSVLVVIISIAVFKFFVNVFEEHVEVFLALMYVVCVMIGIPTLIGFGIHAYTDSWLWASAGGIITFALMYKALKSLD